MTKARTPSTTNPNPEQTSPSSDEPGPQTAAQSEAAQPWDIVEENARERLVIYPGNDPTGFRRFVDVTAAGFNIYLGTRLQTRPSLAGDGFLDVFVEDVWKTLPVDQEIVQA